jgi:hypothetical protein
MAMGARLRAFFNPANGDRLRAPRRIFWVGFLVRVAAIGIAHTYRMRVANEHFEFGWEMGRIAQALATGYGYADPFIGHSGPTAWTPPLYPLILAGVFKLFGIYTIASAWVILTINCVFSAATAPAIYQIAWWCFGTGRESEPRNVPGGLNVALWSAWLWALYPAAMQYAVKWVWDMALTAFLFSWVVVLALRLRDSWNPVEPTSQRRDVGHPALFGLLWGLIALANSSLLTFLPACGLWMVWPVLRTRVNLGAALRKAALAAACFLGVITPWIARNWVAFHAFVPMRANFGAELYEATIFANDGFPTMATPPLSEHSAQYERYRSMGEVAYSRELGDRAKAKIREHPGLFLSSVLRRVYFFWISVPHPTDAGIMIEAVRRVNFCFFSITGWLGLALALRRRVFGAWLFFWAFALFPLIYYVVTVQARFRHPLEPIICVLSVYLFQSADRTRAWSRRGDAHNSSGSLPVASLRSQPNLGRIAR